MGMGIHVKVFGWAFSSISLMDIALETHYIGRIHVEDWCCAKIIIIKKKFDAF